MYHDAVHAAAVLPRMPFQRASIQRDSHAAVLLDESACNAAPHHREHKSSWGCRGVGAMVPDSFGNKSGVGNTPRGGRQQ